MLIPFVIILCVLVFVALLPMLSHNRLVRYRQSVNQGAADIDAQLRQRHDLVPKLIATVRAHVAHETEVLTEVSKAGETAVEGGLSSDDEARLKTALNALMDLSEAEPQIRSSDSFEALRRELKEVEERLAAARRALNAAVARYNAELESFPAVYFANSAGFIPADFSALADSEEGTVDPVSKIDFSAK